MKPIIIFNIVLYALFGFGAFYCMIRTWRDTIRAWEMYAMVAYSFFIVVYLILYSLFLK